MAEKTVNEEIEPVFNKLKSLLISNNCRIAAEDAPISTSIIHGSLWGISPKSAQKKTEYHLRRDFQGTHIVGTSTLTGGYINLTLSGVALSIGLMLLCVWMALDLQTYSSMGIQGFWGWLVQVHGSVNLDLVTLFVRLGWVLATLLAITLVAEGIIIARVRSRINVFAEEILKTL